MTGKPDRASDHTTIVIVVATVAAIALILAATTAGLALLGRTIPDQLDNGFVLVIGLLGGFIAKTSSGPQEVVAPPGVPVSVEEVDPPAPKK